MTIKRKNKTVAGKKKEEVVFRYDKAINYRTIYIDGAHGGLTAKGLLAMELFMEKKPLPRTDTYEVVDGKLKDPPEANVDEVVLREVQACIMMDINTMVSLHAWLESKINIFQTEFSPRGSKN